MNIKEIIKVIYWKWIPLFVGLILFRYTGVYEANSIFDTGKILISNLYIIIIIVIVHIAIGNIFFKMNDTHIDRLANKMMRCKFRRKYGNSYCAKCPDGYTCAENNI